MLVLPAAFMLSPAQAAVIGGWDISAYAAYDFDTTSGTFFVGNSDGEALAIGDMSVDSFVTATSDPTATVGLTFAGGELVKSSGFELVLFEIGTAESMTVSVNGTPLGSFTPSPVDPQELITGVAPTGETGALNAVGINLDSFDLSVEVTIELGLAQSGADFALAGALTAVPVPAAVWLFGSGLLGLVGVARRKK